MLSHSAHKAPQRLQKDDFPKNWHHTDDTGMALSICSILRAHGHIHQNALAARFTRRHQLDPDPSPTLIQKPSPEASPSP